MGKKPGTVEYYGIQPRSPLFTCVDLFAGAGGLSLGLHWAGFKSVLAVEFDAAAADTYDENFGKVIARTKDGRPLSVEGFDYSHLKASQIDLVAGGPPCQGFSSLGKQLEDDPRNKLWREFMRAVEEIQPRAFLMENVPELLKSEEGAETIRTGKRLGYKVVSGVLSANHYGVPQKRRRAFIIGVKGHMPFFPKPVAVERTVRWAFAGLPLVPTDKDLHIGRTPTNMSIERYKVVPEGGNRFDLMKARPDITPKCWLNKPTGSTDVFGRLWWDQPSLTIRTEFYKPEKGRSLHPSEHRPITHREAARLQSFTDNFKFQGSKTDIARQIGNAVPPILAYYLGTQIAEILNGNCLNSGLEAEVDQLSLLALA